MDGGSGASSSRVFQLAKALYNRDQVISAFDMVTGRPPSGGRYLERASGQIATWINEDATSGDGILSGYVTQVDRHLSLCLTDAGPRYALKGSAALSGMRKRGYTYYTSQFAELLFSVAVRPEIKGRPRAVQEELLRHFISIGCENAFLLPTRNSLILGLLGDVCASQSVATIRGRCLKYLAGAGEFEIPRRDGTYKLPMSLSSQPKQGAKIRKNENSRASLNESRERLHVAHTVATADGAAIAASAEFSERQEITIASLKRSLMPRGRDTDYSPSVRLIFTDRARDIDDATTWEAFPNLVAVAAGPLRRCLEVEA